MSLILVELNCMNEFLVYLFNFFFIKNVNFEFSILHNFTSQIKIMHLINFNSRINLSNKPKTSKKPNRPSKQTHHRSHNPHIPIIQHRTTRLNNIKFTVKKMNSIQKEIDTCHSRC